MDVGPLVPDAADGPHLDLVLDASTAEGADLPAVGVDDHQRAGLLGGRALRLDHLADDPLAAGGEGFVESSEQVAHGPGSRVRSIVPTRL